MSKKRKHKNTAKLRFEAKTSAPVTVEKAEDVNDAEKQYNLGMKYACGDGVEQDYAKAFSCFKNAAELGYAPAQFQLAECYRLGRGVEKDIKRALPWFEKAASQGHAEAQNIYGMCFALGNGVEKDNAKAFFWIEKAAVQGLSYAQNNLGYFYKFGVGVEKDYEKSVYWYELSAKQGYAQAQFGLGNTYFYGTGVKENKEKAAYWYEQAAQQGDAASQNKLGIYYSDTVHKYPEAIFWYKKAADQGHDFAMLNLGNIYLEGRVGEKNYEEAAYWYEKAVKAGNWAAKTRLEEVQSLLGTDRKQDDPEKLYSLGKLYFYGESVERDFEKAFKYYFKAAEMGHAPSQCEVADCYNYGHGTKKNEDEAIRWYEMSAKQGYAEAQYKLGECYHYGFCTQEDIEKAIFWLEKSAQQGNEQAQSSLAMYYHHCSEADATEKAIYWLEKSVANGDSYAMYYLATRYLNGRGVEKDEDKGWTLMRQAAEAGNSNARGYFRFDEEMNNKSRMIVPENVIRKAGDREYVIDITDTTGVYGKVYYHLNLNEREGRIKGCSTLLEFGGGKDAGFESDDVWESDGVTTIFAGWYDNPLCYIDEIHALFVIKNDNSFGVEIQVFDEPVVNDTIVGIVQNMYNIKPKTMLMIDLAISSYMGDHLNPEDVYSMNLTFEFTNVENTNTFYQDITLG